MSLLTSASPWTNEDNTNKKRIPTMRKPQKIEEVASPSPKQSPLSASDAQEIQEERSNHVNELLNKMTTMGGENDHTKHLGDFVPPPPPELNQRKPIGPLLPLPQTQQPAMAKYGANDEHLGKLSNYQQSYERRPLFEKPASVPYYAKPTSMNDDKLMERINYMIHLLEEQQHEKTANVTEEFLLYTFLGVFVIYVVDAFSRTGKYVR
jgi:hypothetical protein